jgi:hypothetical protein
MVVLHVLHVVSGWRGIFLRVLLCGAAGGWRDNRQAGSEKPAGNSQQNPGTRFTHSQVADSHDRTSLMQETA